VVANEPPTPAKVAARHATHLAEALARGTLDGRKMIGTVLKDRVRELVEALQRPKGD